MALETTPPSQQSDGYLRITFVPTASNNLSVAILAAGTAKDLTYSLTPDGFNRQYTENQVDDPRLTNVQILNRPGTFTEKIDLRYVVTDLSATDVAYTAIGGSGVGQVTGLLTVRYGIPNATAWTIGQKVDSITFVSGKPRREAPTANGLFIMAQTLYLTAPTVSAASLVA
jgi:hypothetical protein